MIAKPTFLLALCVVLLSGCGRTPTTMAGGKPVSYWVEALRSPDAHTRKQAVSKLGNVGGADPEALPALLGALRDSDPSVRREAILAVVKARPDAQEVVPILTEMQQKDRDAQVRAYAAKALVSLQVGT